MFLIENGYFGDPDPDANSLHKLLVVAFRDFKSFQKERGITCSQTKFVPNFAPWKTLAIFSGITLLTLVRIPFRSFVWASPNKGCKVWKPDKHGAHMSHKGYNGRVIVLWLGDCLERAAAHRITPERDLGQWLVSEGRPWPDNADNRFAPICAAMPL